MFLRVAIILSVGLLLLGFTFVDNGTRFVARGQTTADSAKNLMSLPRYRASVADLASDEMEGRKIGTPGSAKAIRYIEARFKTIGLAPGYQGKYVQNYHHSYEGEAEAANVIALLEGSDAVLKNEFVVVSAHFDHLGRSTEEGCPDQPDGDCIMPGTNDNASGVAALFELAHAFVGMQDELKRTIVFVAFDGEECGCTGSNYYVEKAPAVPLDATVSNINIDEIGEGGFIVRYDDVKVNADIGENCPVDAVVFARRGVRSLSVVGDSSQHHECTDTPENMRFDEAFETLRAAFDIVHRAVQETAE